MSELCLPSTPKKTTQVSSLLLSDLQLFFSFILSHPLYFSYFIFFSPYLLKLLSFLSPLFITTSLLLFAFLTVHENSSLELSESKLGFLLSTYHAVVERLRAKTDNEDEEEFHHFEEFEAYKIVFDTSTFYAREKSDEVLELRSEENCFQALEPPVFQSSSNEISGVSVSEVLVDNLEEKTVEIAWEETTDQQSIMEEKRLEGFLKVLDEFENMQNRSVYHKENRLSCNLEENKVSLLRSRFEAIGDKKKDGTVKVSTDNGGEYTSKVAAKPQTFDANVVDSPDNGGEYTPKFLESPSSRTLDSNLGSYGSMRREKEWKRTLACKLFEERHNVDGSEGMDLLWETYEADSSNRAKSKSNTKKKKNKKISDSECYMDDDDELEDMNGQLCCLQALKFSTRKMNLGMGRPNLVKISKAIKGIGWLHHVTRHGKKGYN